MTNKSEIPVWRIEVSLLSVYEKEMESAAEAISRKLVTLGMKSWPATKSQILLGLLVKAMETVRAVRLLIDDRDFRANVAHGLLRPLLEVFVIVHRLKESDDPDRYERLDLHSRAWRLKAAIALGYASDMPDCDKVRFEKLFGQPVDKVNRVADWLGTGRPARKIFEDLGLRPLYESLYNLTSASLHGKDYYFFVTLGPSGFERTIAIDPFGMYGQALKLFGNLLLPLIEIASVEDVEERVRRVLSELDRSATQSPSTEEE